MSLLPALAGQAAPLLEAVLPLALLWDRFEFSNRVHDCLGLKGRFEYSVLAVSHHLGIFRSTILSSAPLMSGSAGLSTSTVRTASDLVFFGIFVSMRVTTGVDLL